MKTPFIAFAVSLFSIATALALDPAPDGGYAGQNTAEGEDALFSLTTGENNTAVGFHSLHDLTDSSGNTAVGALALAVATAGPNTAVGYATLSKNTTGYNNTALDGLVNNTTGHDNTSIGLSSLGFNTIGSYNTAVGVGALSNNNGDHNTAMGDSSMLLNDTGSYNVAIGGSALNNSTAGNYNVALGFDALAQARGSNNIGIGANAGNSVKNVGSNNIEIGNSGEKRDDKTIRIGTEETHVATFIAGVRGATVADGIPVMIASNGQLGTVPSSSRYKEQIKSMGESSAAIERLEPVTFRYKKELDPVGIPQFGLVAEEVEKIAPDLVVLDNQGKAYSVRYEAVNAMLLNEFLKEHRRAEERREILTAQEQKIERLEKALTKLQRRIEKETNSPKTPQPISKTQPRNSDLTATE